MDTATDARVRLLLQIRQLLTDPRSSVSEHGWGPPKVGGGEVGDDGGVHNLPGGGGILEQQRAR